MAVLIHPFIPFSSEAIWKQLKMDSSIKEVGWKGIKMPLPEGKELEKPAPQFAKVEASSSGEFQKYTALDLRIGKVTDVQQHPNGDKLYVMKVDIGRPITIVSGLKEYYTADELRTKTLVIVSNLEPATLRGVKSEGMLLAAEAGQKLALLTPEKDLPAGTQVTSGLEPGKKALSFKEFQKLDIRVGVLASDAPPVLDIGGRKLQCVVDNGQVGKVYPAFLSGEKSMVMTAADGTKMVFDRDIEVGAKIR
jgi:methionyl-tRNA synthetase